jgi:hypothetical protein
MTTYSNPYTGQTINPSQVGYESLTISTDTTLEWPINGNVSDVVANIIEVTATTTGIELIMPPASSVSEGQSVLIRNIGSNPFTVVKSNLATIVTIASGVAQYIYVTDNTTDAGEWATVTFGTGTSSANAADLAGYGLTAISTTLNQSYEVRGLFSNYAVLITDRASFLVWEGGAGTFTMPSASAVGNNWFVMIRNGGTGILNIAPVGTDTIDGNVSAQLQLSESFVIVSDGTNWNTFGYGQSAEFFYTILSKVVTGGNVTLTSTEAANVIQEYTGVLTSNCVVYLPPTVQLYSLQNNTTGSFTLTFRTAAVGAQTVILPQNQTVIAICDGTNVYNAQTASVTGSNITLANGSAASPSLNFLGDTTTGLFLAGTGDLGFALSGTQGMNLNANGLFVPEGIPSGSF